MQWGSGHYLSIYYQNGFLKTRWDQIWCDQRRKQSLKNGQIRLGAQHLQPTLHFPVHAYTKRATESILDSVAPKSKKFISMHQLVILSQTHRQQMCKHYDQFMVTKYNANQDATCYIVTKKKISDPSIIGIQCEL